MNSCTGSCGSVPCTNKCFGQCEGDCIVQCDLNCAEYGDCLNTCDAECRITCAEICYISLNYALAPVQCGVACEIQCNVECFAGWCNIAYCGNNTCEGGCG